MSQKPLTPRNKSEGSKRASPTGSSRSMTSRTTSTRSTSTRSPSAASNRTARSGSSRSKPAPQPAVIAPPPKPPSFLRTLLEDPDALRNLRHRLPSWTDELVALLLIGLGAVTFASLLNAGGEAGLSTSVAKLLRQGFGEGGYVISLAILGGGILILLPKLGFRLQFTLGRMIALELGFLAFQGLLHILAFDPEGEALAREGRGGGFVGWGVSYFATALGGNTVGIILLSLILLACAHWLVGLRRQHYRQMMGWVSGRMEQLATQIDPQVNQIPAPVAVAEVAPPVVSAPQEPPAPIAPEVPPMIQAAPPATAAPIPAPTRRPASNRGRVNANAGTRPEVAPPPVAMPPQVMAPAATLPPEPLQPTIAAVAEAPVLAVPLEVEESPVEVPFEEEAIALERPALVINGQVIEPSLLGRERPSIVPRTTNGNGEKPKPAVISTAKNTYKGGRDNDPKKRYFAVGDFSERKKIGKRHEYLPPLELLSAYDNMSKPDEEEINRNASIIENTLLEFDIDADVIDVKVGPVVTQYAVSPIKEVYNPETRQWDINRIRVDRITSLQGDLALALSAKTLRIEAPVPGHSYVGIEVPNKKPSIVGLRPVLEAENFFKKHAEPLAIPLGRDVSGEAIVIRLATLPHLLVAGTTGSGKSVFLTSMIMSLIMNNTPEQVKMVMLDPKRVELTRFNGLPHLLGPVETEADRIIGVLRWLTREMDRRYKLMELENARNIDAYNAALGRRRKDEHLPYMVMVFDEIGDLMMSHPDETEGTVTRLAQKARAAGMHLVIATQRPSTEIITGLIKANFPARMSFAVATGIDSRVILDYTGAETLLGKGDMLYLAPDAAGPQRIQGCFVSDEELDEVVTYWRNWYEEQIAEGKLERPRTPPWERGMTRLEALSEQDVLLEQAIALVCEAKEASTSLVQRRLGIGYPRAAHLMDMLYELGVIGPPKSGGQPRSVLITNYKVALKKMSDRNR